MRQHNIWCVCVCVRACARARACVLCGEVSWTSLAYLSTQNTRTHTHTHTKCYAAASPH